MDVLGHWELNLIKKKKKKKGAGPGRKAWLIFSRFSFTLSDFAR